MKYVFMVREETGEEVRAFGSPLLEEVHEFPSYDPDDEAMEDAFSAWKNNLETRGQKDWEQKFGPESRVFLERQYSDMSLGDWQRMGYGGGYV